MSSLHDLLPRTAAAIDEGIERHWQRGAQLSVSHRGRVIDGAIGWSHNDVPLTPDMILPWHSAGKPLTAVAAMRLIEAGEVTLDTRVVEIVPEFADTSREITLRHLLTHTAGLAVVSTGWPHSEWHDVIRGICMTGLKDDWVPGQRAGYDPIRSWFLLGEIVSRIDGRRIEQIIHEDLMRPLGMQDSWMAMPHGVYEEYGDRIGHIYTIKGREQELADGHTAAFCESPSPGSSCRGPIRELRLFYEMLLSGGVTADGERLLNAETVALMTQRHREAMFDETFQHTLDFGLGVIVNSSRYGIGTVPYGFGQRASDQAFGHGGVRSCIAFADPVRHLVVCIVANGFPPEPQHQRRFRQLFDALDEDLGIDGD